MIGNSYRCGIIFAIAVVLPAGSIASNNNHPFNIDRIKIDNKINECVQFTPNTLSEAGNLLLLELNVNKKKSPGYCGCMSRLLTYSIIEKNIIEEQTLTHERSFNIFSDKSFENKRSSFTFVLSADKNVEIKGSVSIVINCKGPD